MHADLNRRNCRANRLILSFALLGCAPVLAVEPAIRDNAGLFTGTALQEAEDRARRIRQTSGRDFVVETFSTIPDSLRPRLDRLGKEQFHSEWALSRSRELGVAGIYVQIVESPGRLEVAVGEQSELQFTAGDRERLRDIMLDYLRNRDFDRALREGVAFVDARLLASGTGSRSEAPWGTGAGTTRTPLDTPSPRGEQRPSWPGLGGSSIGRWICLGVALLAIFVIVRLFRRVGGALGRSGGGMFGGGAPRTGGMFGGGGFGRGILGGLLGGLLGGRLTRGGRTGGGFGGGFFNPRGPSSSRGSSRDRDSGTSGGDFGGGGGRSGGGRTSGGDF